MNPFDEIIHQMQVETSLYVRLHLRAPWGIRFHTGDHARLVVISGNDCWLRWEGLTDPVRLAHGSCMIVQPQVTFDLSDMPDQRLIGCETLIASETEGTVAYGMSGVETEVSSARFSFDAIAAEPLFRSIPVLVHFSLNEKHAALIKATLELIGMETNASEHGSGFVIDRLINTLFVQALRALCSHDTGKTSCWLAGLGDRRLARAIHAVHSDLARRWTVEDMAQEAGLSRSSFAALFRSVVGEAPLDYLTGWRVYRAKMMLTGTDESLLRIANLVGYDSDLSLSRVFKRRTGLAPGRWRQTMRYKGSVHPERARSIPNWNSRDHM